jgi:hypothetical protein
MIAVILLALFLVSCSDSDKFSGEKKQQIWIEGIDYEIDEPGKVSLYVFLQSKIASCFSSNNYGNCTIFSNCYWIINNKCCISLKNLETCHLSSYLWIIDNDTISSFKNPYNAGYGEHLVKLVLVDVFGDSISDSTYIKINKPLKVELLSPINGFSDLAKVDSLVFQYKISGADSWEETQSFIYFSQYRVSLWEEENILPNNVLKPPGPPFDNLRYFWGVITHTEQESDTSEIRCIGC